MIGQTLICDCCGLPVSAEGGGLPAHCPRCEYPIGIVNEKPFLERSVQDLRRVAEYGGANLTVGQLIGRYVFRLGQLQQSELARTQMVPLKERASAQAANGGALVASGAIEPKQSETLSAPSSLDGINAPVVTHAEPQVEPVQQMFSLRSFFAEQTINIVAALGAFLLLAGSLGFIISTSSLLLSFTVIFIAHAIFGVTGIVSYRFRSFRVVAIIYTAIFALLVPLVGFAGYRLVVHRLVMLAPSTIIAIVACYAALVYATLAVLQRFSLFGYLSVVALAVADLSLANALHLYYWWYPHLVLLLALPALLTLVKQSRLATSIDVLQEPLRLLSSVSVVACGIASLVIFLHSLYFDISQQVNGEVRVALLTLLVALLTWTVLYAALRRKDTSLVTLPYQFGLCVVVACYALRLHAVGYVLALIAVAWLCYLLTRVPALSAFFLRFRTFRIHMQVVSLLAMSVLPVIAAPLLSFQLLTRSGLPFIHTPIVLDRATLWDGVALLAAGVLTIVMLVHRLQQNRMPLRAEWYCLPLLTGFLFSCAFGLMILFIGGEPAWWYLVFTLLAFAVAIVARVYFARAWANSLDVIVLFGMCQTILLSLGQGSGRILAVLLCFAAITYIVLLYQRRRAPLFLPLALALLATLPFLYHQSLLFVASLVLPLLAIVVYRVMDKREPIYVEMLSKDEGWGRSIYIRWQWPLLLVGIWYGVVFNAYELSRNVAAIQPWLSFSLWPACELGVIAVAWYAAAIGLHNKYWTIASAFFALLALSYSGNSFLPVAALAFGLVIMAFVCERFVARGWSYALYVVGVVAALVAGRIVPAQLMALETWLLLAFALLIYVCGLVNRQRALAWVAPFFALWSVYSAGGLGDLYRAPLVAFVCILCGIAIAVLSTGSKYAVPIHAHTLHAIAPYRWPLYLTALLCIWLMGLRGAIDGIAVPFYAAIPLALVLFAALIFVVMLIERRPQLLLLISALVVWAVGLMSWPYWQFALTMMALCGLVFGLQWFWHLVADNGDRAKFRRWHTALALEGQATLALITIYKYSFSYGSSTLAHIGAVSFLVLALLLEIWARSSQPTPLAHACRYGAGLLEALVISWELLAFHHTRLDWLTVSPATYLVVIAPFIARDELYAQRRLLSQLFAIAGAVLLLTPTLWLSFSQSDLQPTLILGTESLLLLLLGVVTRIRIFVLCGAALMVVCVMHALFLPSFGLSPSLALVTLGVMLLTIAAGLSLARHRLQHVWSQLN